MTRKKQRIYTSVRDEANHYLELEPTNDPDHSVVVAIGEEGEEVDRERYIHTRFFTC